MSTTIRPELSEKNKYWIDKHRYYELKHFCLQYPIWKKAYAELDGMSRVSKDLAALHQPDRASSPTERCAVKRVFYSERMEMIERAAANTDPFLSGYILTAVTEGLSYDHLKVRRGIPCCKDTYYELYRRFFWLLDKERQ